MLMRGCERHHIRQKYKKSDHSIRLNQELKNGKAKDLKLLTPEAQKRSKTFRMHYTAAIRIASSFKDYALKSLLGKPSLHYLIQRLQNTPLINHMAIFGTELTHTILLDTSRIHRTPLYETESDHLQSYFAAIRKTNPSSSVLCINANSPLFDCQLVQKAAGLSPSRLTTTSGFPLGQEFAIVPPRFLETLSWSKSSKQDLIGFIVDTLPQDVIQNLEAADDYSTTRFSIECEASFERVEEISLYFTKNPEYYSLKDLIEFSRLSEADSFA